MHRILGAFTLCAERSFPISTRSRNFLLAHPFDVAPHGPTWLGGANDVVGIIQPVYMLLLAARVFTDKEIKGMLHDHDN